MMVKLLNTQLFKKRIYTRKPPVSFRNTWVSVVLNIFEISEAERFGDSRARNQLISRNRLIFKEEQSRSLC